MLPLSLESKGRYKPLTTRRARRARDRPIKTASCPESEQHVPIAIEELLSKLEAHAMDMAKPKPTRQEPARRIKRVPRMLQKSDQEVARIFSEKRKVLWSINMASLQKHRCRADDISRFINEQSL